MNSCDKLIESLQKMFGKNSQLIERYRQISDLLDFFRHPFAAFVKRYHRLCYPLELLDQISETETCRTTAL